MSAVTRVLMWLVVLLVPGGLLLVPAFLAWKRRRNMAMRLAAATVPAV